MNPTNIIHESWNPIKGLLYQEPLLTFQQEILPSISFNPEPQHIFRVFSMPVQDIKIVIIGQDPYPNPKHASGYAFHPKDPNYTPASLRIINNEVLKTDGEHVNKSGKIDLSTWPEQGIFLLNTALTVERGKAGTHLNYWKNFTDRVIKFIAQTNPCIWMLWGNGAKKAMNNIPGTERILVDMYDDDTIDNIPISEDMNYPMSAPHPMVEVYKNGNFYGQNHFKYANKILQKKRESTIIW